MAFKQEEIKNFSKLPQPTTKLISLIREYIVNLYTGKDVFKLHDIDELESFIKENGTNTEIYDFYMVLQNQFPSPTLICNSLISFNHKYDSEWNKLNAHHIYSQLVIG